MPPQNVIPVPDVKVAYSLMGSFGVELFVFIILVVISWVILFTLKPRFVQNESREQSESGKMEEGASTGKCLVWSIVFGLVIVSIIWMFRAS
jgi:hypothetical protein